MDRATVLGLVKASLGITSAVRDTLLAAIAEGVITELEDEKGLVLDGTNSNHLMFVVDFTTWRYRNKDSSSTSGRYGNNPGMPRDLQYRLHNLMVHNPEAE